MSASNYISELFEGYAAVLEAEYDLYENLVKKGRDITYESKKIIFLLHRVENKEDDQKILNQARERLRKVFLQITVDIGSLLKRNEVFKYIRAFKPGIEEFVEAASFYYYLIFGALITYDEMCDARFLLEKESVETQDEDKKGLNMSDILTFSDFLLGIMDLTGELMRKCICTKSLEEPYLLRDMLHGITLALHSTSMNRDLKRKYLTLKENLLKVEKVCCSIQMRKSEMERIMEERGTPMEIDQSNIIESAFNSEQEPTFGFTD